MKNYMRIAKASLLVIVIGVILIVLSLILRLISILVTDTAPVVMDLSPVDIVGYVNMGYSYLMIPVFLVLYFWAGIRGVKKFRLDAVAGGAVSAFSYFVIGLISLFLNMVLNALVMTQVLGGATYGSTESVLAAYLFGEIAGALGLGVSAICGIGVLLFGTLVAFVIGGFGALYALRRTPKFD